MYRNTYLEINTKNIKENVSKIIKKYNNYKYYIGVVKADCYGHGIEVVKEIIEAGCNYLATATLEEAITLRKKYKDIPILCLGIIPTEYFKECIKNNITITISNVSYLLELIKIKPKNLKVHIKINTGMNRLGINSKEEFNTVYKLIKENGIFLEGIYTHIYNSENKKKTEKQFSIFLNITKDINLKQIPIVHITASDATTEYIKKDYVNGCRLGIIMYGFTKDLSLELKSTYKLISEVIQINKINKNDTVGYNGIYKSNKKENIAVVSIGYADGIIRKNTNRYVHINNKKYKIVGNICMDMLFVKVDNKVKIKDKVEIIKDIEDIKYISKHLKTIPYEILCIIGKRVPRVYK